MKHEIRREITNTLKATGLPWDLERGKKHIHIVLAGHRIGVYSPSNKVSWRDLQNLTANIRRCARELHGQAV